MSPVADHFGFISLEPYDVVWRRNQHVAHQSAAEGLVDRLTFVEPASPPVPKRVPPPSVRSCVHLAAPGFSL